MSTHHLAFRVCAAAVLMLAGLRPAEAQRSADCQDTACFVRIIWDVGSNTFHVRTYAFTSEQPWSFPPRVANGFEDFTQFDRGNRHVIRRADHVRLHVTNYNPVSHKPLKGQVLTLTPEIPFSLSLLSALVASVSGGAASFLAKTMEAAPERPRKPSDPCDQAGFSVNDCLDRASNELNNTFQHLEKLSTRLATFKKLDDGVKGFGDLTTTWVLFDNRRVDAELDALIRALVPDGNYAAFVTQVDADLSAVTQSIVDASSAVANVDVNCAAQKPNDTQFGACVNAASRRDRVHAGVTALTQQLLDTDHTRTAIAVGVTHYESAKSLIASFKRKLALSNEADFVADVDVTTSAPDNGRLVLDMPFGSLAKDSTKMSTLSVVLRTDDAYPGLFATVGMLAVVQPFDFQDAALVDVLNDQKTGVNKRWAVKPSDKFLPIGAALLTHVHVGGTYARALYVSFGTTIDKNVFSNLLVGASAYVPRWRAVLTFGVIGARGSVEEDFLVEFSKLQDDKNNAFGSVTELPDTRKWHWKPAVSLSFKPF